MKLLEASKILEELSGGKYRNLEYRVNYDGHGGTNIECAVYIHGQGYHSGITWEEAIQSMEYAIYPERKPTVVEDIDEDAIS